MKDAVVRN